MSAAVSNLLTQTPGVIGRLASGFYPITLAGLDDFDGQNVVIDPLTDYLGDKPRKVGKQHLVLTMQVRNPDDNTIVSVCTAETCQGDEEKCKKCVDDRATSNNIRDASFRQKLLHLKRLKTAEPITVADGKIVFDMRINCSTVHHNVNFFIFLVELVDQDGDAKFRGAFTAEAPHSIKGSRGPSPPPIAMIAV